MSEWEHTRHERATRVALGDVEGKRRGAEVDVEHRGLGGQLGRVGFAEELLVILFVFFWDWLIEFHLFRFLYLHLRFLFTFRVAVKDAVELRTRMSARFTFQGGEGRK